MKTVIVKPIEIECLDKVFNYLISKDPKKHKDHKKKIGPGDLMRVLTFLGLKPLPSEVSLIVWEVDDDLDGYVSKEEFMTMYKRCISDETGLEPRKLFNLTQFLMYDKTFKGRVTVEETLQILFVRYGRANLDNEIDQIFGGEEKNPDGSEKEITFGEYVDKINKRALEENKLMNHKKRMGILPSQEKEEED